VSGRDDFYIPEDVAEWIGLKKSEYLSKLIQLQKPDDLSFEVFHLYDSFIQGTIEAPDKTMEEMVDGKLIRRYLRTYKEKGGFHQLLIGVVITDNSSSSEVFVPILTFVTKHPELVVEFSSGQVINRPVLN
jgi:hypothetical protein